MRHLKGPCSEDSDTTSEHTNWGYVRVLLGPYEPLSKLLVSPLISPIIVPYVIPYITPFKEFRL